MTNIHTYTDQILIKPSLIPATRTSGSDMKGTGVDALGFDRCVMVANIGAHDNTTGDETMTFRVQGSVDDVDGHYADITSATVTVGVVVPDTTSGTVYTVNVNLAKAGKRWIRAVAKGGGTTPSTVCAVAFHLFNARYKGVTQDRTPVSV